MQARQHMGSENGPAVQPNLSRELAGMHGLPGTRENKKGERP
jgi:hypothetical protein